MDSFGSLTASSSRTAWTWTQRGWSVWQRTGRQSSTGDRSKRSTFISDIAILFVLLILIIIIVECIVDNHSKAEYFPRSRMKKIADGLIHYRRSSESSSITSSSAGSVGLFTLTVFLGRCKKSIISHESIKSRNEYTYQAFFIPGQVLPVQLYYTNDHGNLTKVSSCKPQDLLKCEY